jgi:hypothetical protein
MHLVLIAWAYVVLLMALVEGMSSAGTWLGAFFTLLLYGVLPLSIVLYVMATPARRRRRNSVAQPDGSGHAPADTVAPVREEP